ncbi:MAG: nitrile hydratase subunit alpha [Proteobacteria bacterium]|nr:nitrile hydratase subunit alpha [Pseudomonadota bacterium]
MAGANHPHDHDIAPDDDDTPGKYEILEAALRKLFLDKGLFTAAALQAEVAAMESRTPELGAHLVAHAWRDPAILALALDDAIAAAAAVGLDMTNAVPVRAVVNTPDIHHLVVCTLCSCYPRPLLGPPPSWYKSRAYRAKAVIDPRGILHEFGTELPAATDIRTVDSTADLRYLVIPRRPGGTDDWTHDQLKRLVTRDSMIGVGLAKMPSEVA